MRRKQYRPYDKSRGEDWMRWYHNMDPEARKAFNHLRNLRLKKKREEARNLLSKHSV